MRVLLAAVVASVAVSVATLIPPAPVSAATTTTTVFAMTDQPCYAGSAGSTYPPSGEATWSGCGTDRANVGPGSGDMRTSRSYYAGESTPHTASNVFARWNTSALPDNAQVISATVEWPVVASGSVDGRDLTADWYLPTGGLCVGACYSHGDFSVAAGTSAQTGIPVAELVPGEIGYVDLDNVMNVSRTGMTGIRLHVSGGAATGENYVVFSATDVPRLVVTFQAPEQKVVDDTIGPLFASAWTASGQGARGGAQVAAYNQCADRCRRNDSDPYFKPGDADAQVVFMANSVPTTPWIIGLTETCRTNVFRITILLADRGVFGNFFPATSQASVQTAPCRQYGFGSGLITIGGTISELTPFPLGNGRKMQCLYKQGFGFTWSACVTHLSAGAPALACQQLALARAHRNSLGQNVIVAGDLNLDASQVAGGAPCTPSQAWPTSEDVDYPDLAPTFQLGNQTDTTAEKKLDWILARESWFPASSGGTACAADRSDHCYLYGAFSL